VFHFHHPLQFLCSEARVALFIPTVMCRQAHKHVKNCYLVFSSFGKKRGDKFWVEQ
jgi:hypothetical protein